MTFGAAQKTTVFYILLLLSVQISASAQERSALYFLSDIPQSSLENPAIQNRSGKLIIGIPLLSGMSGNWDTNVPFNALFSEGFSYSFHRLYNSLNDQGNLRVSADVSMFFASLQHNNYTFSLSISERLFSTAEFDREIVRFIRDGTLEYLGMNEELGTASFFMSHFREIAPAISKRVSAKLDIGIRPKILFSKLQVESRDLFFSVETDEMSQELLLKPEGSFVLSGPYSHEQDPLFNFSRFTADISPGDYFFSPRNLGFALDLGLIYRPGQQSEWSLSLLDAGWLGVKHNTYEARFTRPVQYSGSSIYQSHSPENNDYKEPREALRAFGDSISYIIVVNEPGKRVYTMLPVRIHAGYKYQINEKTKAGLKNQLLLYNKQLQNRFTPYAEIRVTQGFHVYGSLTLLNTSAVMPGFGFSYTGNWLQLYLATHNIAGIIQPASTKHLNLSVGINLLFDTP